VQKGLQDALDHEIPLTAALGLRVEEAGPEFVRLALPLGPNHNHKQTAFGGSLYSAAVLAGWGLLWCALKDRGVEAQVVIVGSAERFLKPVAGDFTAEAALDAAVLDQALKLYARRGLARVDLDSVVFSGGEACVAFQGTYGLVAKKTALSHENTK
jgi:thioesterase domain-containing protein